GTGYRTLHPSGTIWRKRCAYRYPLGHLCVWGDTLSPAYKRIPCRCTQTLPSTRKPGAVKTDQFRQALLGYSEPPTLPIVVRRARPQPVWEYLVQRPEATLAWSAAVLLLIS